MNAKKQPELIDAIAELKARSARTELIDEEWLRDVMEWIAIGNTWYPPASQAFPNCTMPVVMWCRVDGTIRLGGGNEWCSGNDATRGQLLDLLRALKGGAE